MFKDSFELVVEDIKVDNIFSTYIIPQIVNKFVDFVGNIPICNCNIDESCTDKVCNDMETSFVIKDFEKLDEFTQNDIKAYLASLEFYEELCKFINKTNHPKNPTITVYDEQDFFFRILWEKKA